MPTIGFPLLLIPIAIYNIVVFLMPGAVFTAPLFTLPLLSGVAWDVSFNDLVLTLGIFLLMFEFARASRPGAKYAMDHLLSLIVLVSAAAEFLWLAPFGTSAFFLLVVLAAVDFLSGLTLGLRHRAARRAMRRAAEADGMVVAPVAKPSSPPPVPAPAPVPVHHVETRTPSRDETPPSHHPQMEVITPAIDSAPQAESLDTATLSDVGEVLKVEPSPKPDTSANPPPIIPRRD